MKIVYSVIVILIIISYFKFYKDDPVTPDDTLNYIESLPSLKQIHESNILKLISQTIDITKEDSELLATQKDGPKTRMTKQSNLQKWILEKRVKEIERAITTLEAGLDQYKVVRVKIFPVEKVKNIISKHRVTSKKEMKFISIENINSLNVKEVDWTNGDIIKSYGEFKKINIHLQDPTNLFSPENKLILIKDTFSSLGKEELRLDKLTSSSTSIIITPANPNRPRSIAYGSSDDDYYNEGFSKVSWGLKKYFYRGSFDITFAYRYLSGLARIWTVVNLVDMYDYMHSVASVELKQAKGNIEAKKAQTIAARTYAVLKASQARTKKFSPRTWDLLPTTVHQLYLGAKSEIILFEDAVRNTKDKILVVDTKQGLRPAFTEYFGCTNQRTLDDHNPPRMDLLVEQEPRNVPSVVDCRYARGQIRTKRDVIGKILAYGHGRGMCQKCAIHLAKDGWNDDSKEPTYEDAFLPADIRSPWKHDAILMYFYNKTKIKNISEVTLVSR